MQGRDLSTRSKDDPLSVTHPDAGLAPSRRHPFAAEHPQLAPFLVALAIFVATGAIALAFTGLPA